MSDTMTIQLEGKSYAIDDFELGELEWLEDELGKTLDEVNWSSMKAAVRVVYLIKRRDNPEFSMEDARKTSLRILTDEPEAKPAGAKRPTKAKATAS
jgi:hypothetical protein